MGGTNPDKDAGNGVIMRLSPVPVYWSNDLEKAFIMTRLQTSTTHNVQETLDGSTLMTFMIWHGINGKNKTEIFEMIETCPDLKHLEIIELTKSNAKWRTKTANEIRTLPGRCLWTLEAAMWSVWNKDNFKDAVVKSVWLGGDCDTVGFRSNCRINLWSKNDFIKLDK